MLNEDLVARGQDSSVPKSKRPVVNNPRKKSRSTSLSTAENAFAAIRRRETVLAAEVDALDEKELRRHPLLAVNGKTGFSLDSPIGHTCRPTPTCAKVCSAARPGAPSAWDKSLRKRLRDFRYFKTVTTAEALGRLEREFRRRQRSWARRGVETDYLRVNGTGDLYPELVRVVNEFARRNPDVRVWIVTRQLELASHIEPLPNVYLMISLDASTPPHLRRMALGLSAKHPRALLSFLRTDAADDTSGASIVFNEKRTPDLPFDPVTDCPVDGGVLALGNIRGVGGTACATCRKCFSPPVLDRQRRLLGEHETPDNEMPTTGRFHLPVLGAV